MRHKIKVFEIVSSLNDGGVETLVKDYALHLDKNLFEVKIIVKCLMPFSANTKHVYENGITVIPIYKNKKQSIVLKIWQKITQGWYFPCRLRQIIRQEKPDVIHTHHMHLKYINKVRNNLAGVKLFHTCHSLPSIYLSGKEGIAARTLIQNNDLQLISLHDDMRQEINKMFDIDNTVIMRNGIDFKRFQNIKETKIEIRKSIGIPEDAFVVGHIGRFTPTKNHAFLIDVFKELSFSRDNARLLLIGSGELMDKVKEKIKSYNLENRVTILSNRTDIPQLLQAMDVFVFPSSYEGLGIVLVEAQVSNLRCVVSDCVPKEAFMTNLAVPVSLKAPVSEWCEAIINESIHGQSYGDISGYDMSKEVKRLEKLYMGELNE